MKRPTRPWPKYSRGSKELNRQEFSTVEQLFDTAIWVLNLHGKIPEPVQWASENFIDPISGELIKFEEHQARIFREALSRRKDGSSVYQLVVWSEPKKSGKTAIAGVAGAYVACNIEAPNDICTVANDQEQSAGRIFASMLPTLERQGARVPEGVSPKPVSLLQNGTVVRAITTRYQGEAGANQGMTLWSELWAFSGERLERLWEEMTPPPTRKFRMRWVETYAGFVDESVRLWNLYTMIFRDETERELQPDIVKLWDDLPVYVYEPAHMLLYWSHEHRMPWQTLDYYDTQRAELRPNAYRRLHLNEWVRNEDEFITTTMWRSAVNLPGEPSRDQARGSVFALDGAKNGDCYALVGTRTRNGRVQLTHNRIWELNGIELQQSEVEGEVKRLHKEGVLRILYYDPYQLVGMAQRLREIGIPCEEFGQMGDRTKADTFLYRLFNEGGIDVWDDPLLNQHITAARAKELDGQRVRIVKPKEGDPDRRKVDGAVALSMSAYKAFTQPQGGWAW